MNKRILVTNANGFIGRYIVDLLKQNNYIVRAHVKPGSDVSSISRNASEIVQAELQNQEALHSVLDDCDGIIHNVPSAITFNQLSKNEECAIEVRNLIQTCNHQGIQKFILLSSMSAIRTSKSDYGRAMQVAEQLLTLSNLDYTILRPTLVYGRESHGFNQILKVIRQFPKVIPMIGWGQQMCQPIYVWDVAEIVVRCLRTDKVKQKSYNIGGCERLAFRNLVLMIADIFGVKKRVLPIPLSICELLGSFFQNMVNPIYTPEHIRSLNHDTIVEISPIMQDLTFIPQPLRPTLLLTYDEIINDKTERTIPTEYRVVTAETIKNPEYIDIH